MAAAASTLAKSWADAVATRAAAHIRAASARFWTCLAASVWCGDQRDLPVKIGAITGFAEGRLTGADKCLKFFAAGAAAISKDWHDCSRTHSLILGMCPSKACALAKWTKARCDRVAHWTLILITPGEIGFLPLHLKGLTAKKREFDSRCRPHAEIGRARPM